MAGPQDDAWALLLIRISMTGRETARHFLMTVFSADGNGNDPPAAAWGRGGRVRGWRLAPEGEASGYIVFRYSISAHFSSSERVVP